MVQFDYAEMLRSCFSQFHGSARKLERAQNLARAFGDRGKVDRKSILIRYFASQHYQAALETNFFEQPEAVSIIEGAGDTENLLLRISTLANQEFVAGGTLLFFVDEIQEFQDVPPPGA